MEYITAIVCVAMISGTVVYFARCLVRASDTDMARVKYSHETILLTDRLQRERNAEWEAMVDRVKQPPKEPWQE